MNKLEKLMQLPRFKLPLYVVCSLFVLGALHVALTGLHVGNCTANGCWTIASTLALILVAPASPITGFLAYMVNPWVLLTLFVILNAGFYFLIGYIYEIVRRDIKRYAKKKR